MTTILKRDSENQMPNATDDAVPELKKSKSSEPKAKSAVDHTSDFLAAWGAGRFNSDDVDAVYAALAEFFAEDCIMDASSGAHSGVPAYKVHHGFAGLKDWFDFLGGFNFEGMELSHVEGTAPNEVWLKCSSATAICKNTGKSVTFHGFSVFTWEGDKATKYVMVPYNPASVAAICSEEDVSIPSTVQLPAFEPHPSPSEPFGEAMALWGAGEFSKAEVRSEFMIANAVDDFTDGALPDVLKAYTGIDGTGEILDHIATTWEMTNLDASAPVVGLKAGCVMTVMKFDVKHKATGKEAKGVTMYQEAAYNAEGKFVYSRKYWLNAPLLASIY